MKKFYLSAIFAVGLLAMSSCSSVRHTAAIVPVTTTVESPTKADLVVSSQKISYTFRPSSAVRRTGEKGVISTAVAEALKANGNADVLVAFQYEIKKSRNIFGHQSIKYVTVEGYPATYANMQPVEIH